MGKFLDYVAGLIVVSTLLLGAACCGYTIYWLCTKHTTLFLAFLGGSVSVLVVGWAVGRLQNKGWLSW